MSKSPTNSNEGCGKFSSALTSNMIFAPACTAYLWISCHRNRFALRSRLQMLCKRHSLSPTPSLDMVVAHEVILLKNWKQILHIHCFMVPNHTLNVLTFPIENLHHSPTLMVPRERTTCTYASIGSHKDFKLGFPPSSEGFVPQMSSKGISPQPVKTPLSTTFNGVWQLQYHIPLRYHT